MYLQKIDRSYVAVWWEIKLKMLTKLNIKKKKKMDRIYYRQTLSPPHMLLQLFRPILTSRTDPDRSARSRQDPHRLAWVRLQPLKFAILKFIYRRSKRERSAPLKLRPCKKKVRQKDGKKKEKKKSLKTGIHAMSVITFFFMALFTLLMRLVLRLGLADEITKDIK